MCSPTSIQTLLAVAAALTLFSVRAERTSNSFFTIEGEGVRIASDGGVCVDAGASGPVTLTARSGWLVNGRESIVYPSPKGLSSGLILTSKLGEDHSCSPPPPTEKEEHDTNFVFKVEANPTNLIAMYALPATSVAMTVTAHDVLLEAGRHRVMKIWKAWECSVCGAKQEARTNVSERATAPDAWAWTATAVGRTFPTNVWSGPMFKGLGQKIEFTATGRWSQCSQCKYTTNAVVRADVHELSIKRPDYLGLDRTDAGLSGWAVTNATACIDPEPASAIYHWTRCGKCQFVGATNEQTVTYGITNSAAASTKFRAEDLKVRATASNADGLSASATCTTNFTVVAVDVEIGGVGEDKEEKEGAFVQCVADTNGAISVEGTNKMVAVKFSCNPRLPRDEMVTVAHSGPGELYEVLANGKLVLVTTKSYPACEIASRTFKLHGHRVSSTLVDGEIMITHTASGAKDRTKYTNVKFDIIASCDKLPGSGSFGKNPEVFKGLCLDFGSPDAVPPNWWLPGTRENPSSQVLNIFFKYIRDDDDEPGEFSIKLDADIRPVDLLSICDLEWTQTDGPADVTLTNIDRGHAELHNPPAVGANATSVYKYRLTASKNDFELKSEAWVMIPRAGGEISDWLVNEVPVAVNRANQWYLDVSRACLSAGINPREADEFVRGTAWKYIASAEFDYQGVACNPTPRYSYTDSDLPVADRNFNDFDEPSYATLKGIVVHRAKINNLFYCVWGRVLGYSTWEMKMGAYFNALMRLQWDNSQSQAAIALGGDLYDRFKAGASLAPLMSKSAAKQMQTADSPDGLNDVNLWPNGKLSPAGFIFPAMPTDFDTLKEGDQSRKDRGAGRGSR